MANSVTTKPNQVVEYVRADKMQKMFEERLGKRAGQFTTSLISVVKSNKAIAECEPMTVIQAALTAASMDLPINQNLGFAYIVPYAGKAQFQMGYKGFIQLAQRSGKFKTINTTEVREGEVKARDRMTGELAFEWQDDDGIRNDLPIVGYLAYIELLNGFKKSLYMTKEEIEKHAVRFSQAYRSKGNFQTPWQTDFDLMAQKTVLKLLLNRYAPLSTEMATAIESDQSVDDGTGRRYVDNDPEAAKATESQVDDIVSAHTPAEPTVTTEEAQEAEVVAEPSKETVKQKAARKYGKKSHEDNLEQAGLLDDNNTPSTAG